MSEALIILARHPRAGEVKRRLAAELGVEAARDLYEAFVRDLLSRFPQAIVAVEPSKDEQAFRRLFGFDRTIPQTGLDLGERLERAAFGALRTNERVCLIGSDLPHLPPQVVSEAFEALQAADVVLGPARDGGYYLVGLRREASIFRGIDWSTPRVLAQTLEKASAAGLSTRKLRTLIDVDTMDDLGDVFDEVFAAPLPKTQAVMRGLIQTRPGLFDGGDL